jgi:hypothetical protein
MQFGWPDEAAANMVGGTIKLDGNEFCLCF